MSSTRGERKCALLLTTMAAHDRRHLLAALPSASAQRVRALTNQLLALPLPVADLAQALLADEVAGLTQDTSLDVNQLIELSERLSPAGFARVLVAWTGVDRAFCLALLERRQAEAVGRELQHLDKLPPKLAMALKAEAVAMAAHRQAA